MSVFGVSTFCVVTGASRGIGQCIAVKLSSRFGKDSKIVIIARSEEGLIETKNQIKVVCPTCEVVCVVADLSDPASTKVACEKIPSLANDGFYQHAMFVHNAGSLADVSKKLSDTTDTVEMSHFWHLNVSSAVALNAAFLGYFSGNPKIRKTVVQISSRASEEPVPGLGLYCSAKAARLILFKVLAIEEPGIRVISYAPGPVKTEMWDSLANIHNLDMKSMFQTMAESGVVREPSATVDYLLQILEADEFESGSHVKLADEPVTNDHSQDNE
nr:sepiapterin reductase-like [Ciona intestinalis]|eukprot:XP_002123470.1 sepiapterin reductase-like [Ciona intestinalis]